MCEKRMIGGGWAQQLGWHARPRHTTQLCRHFPRRRRWRRLGAATPPVPGRAGICALVDDDAGSRQRRAFSRKSIVSVLQQAHGVRLTHRSRRQKAAGRRACELQFALTSFPILGQTDHNPDSVALSTCLNNIVLFNDSSVVRARFGQIRPNSQNFRALRAHSRARIAIVIKLRGLSVGGVA